MEFYRRDDGSYTAFGTVAVIGDDSERRSDGDKDEIEVVASTEAIADDGDIIEARSWDLRWFRGLLGKGSGGPVLADHNPSRLIGMAHRVKVDKDAKVLRAWYRHLPEGVTEDGDRARRLAAAGIRMPVSVRWRPRKLVPVNELPKGHAHYSETPITVTTPWGSYERFPNLHTGAQLREFSEVVMPADRGAVQPGRASGGAVLSADQIRDTLQAMARDRDPVLCEVLAEMVEA
ncbi:MAG: hypothetical protein GY913_30390, partial [Proteobacteria bacterium]|nr:hypothetical protein [Pseudomonadota bacterium]